MQGWFNRDEEGKVIVENGYVTITCEGNDENLVFQLHVSEIDEKAEQMCFNVNGKDIYIDVVPFETNDNDFEGDKTMTGSECKESKEEKFNTPTTSKNGNAIFPWCDASTKIFLKEYKLKKELVKHRKLKNMKRAYQEIANNLVENGFSVSPLQVENRYKTLKRAYKNMITHNRRSGRGKYICSYEDDLVEIFSNDIYDTKINDEDDSKDAKEILTPIATKNCSSTENFHLKTLQHNTRLEAQNVKIIENLQSCQRLLKNLITSLDSKNKNSSYMPSGVLQICMEIRDLQKEATTRAEEQREKAKEQRETRNNLLQEIVTILKSRKDT
ncbi:PREDICTED: uncharacterized protein LOC108773631 [Cyphomyrmex costatus]|uniref:Myb/SANT-like DNA-binding domain-containing protein n=1 Tax=Cyphomyrmex costatus TaxID=456900 RepID=A0A195CR96_9HYME|nr:PREDICTED: uncharacterized protein LOC108773631 [Cyphomyrmex costatus]KYN03160.1 hypothetical protein ALC62_06027 [Cyphomyrmex costatus]